MSFIEATGAGEAAAMLDAIATRALDPDAAKELVFTVLAESEQQVFAAWGGKYVRTGRLRDSLTQVDATEGIREAHGGVFDFSTLVPYAVFQGTTGKGRRSPPSAIVKATPEAASKAADVVAAFIAGAHT